MSKYVCILLILAIVCPSQQVLFGTSVEVTANTSTEINFTDATTLIGATLVITVNETTDVTLGLLLVPPRSLPAGIISAGFGFSLSVDSSSASVVSANLLTPDLTFNQSSSLTIMQFNSDSNTYVNVPATTTNKKLNITLPSPAVGSYFAVSFTTGDLIPRAYNQTKELINGIRQTIEYPRNFTVSIQVSNSANLSVAFAETNPVGSESGTEGMVSLDAYWQIDLTGPEQTIDALLRFAYNKSLIALKNAKETTTRIGFFNTTAQAWQFFSSGSTVDVSAGVVTQSTTHFSTYGTYAESAQSTNTNTNTISEDGSSSSHLMVPAVLAAISVAIPLLM